jgi:hypothetical protein
LLDKKPGDFHGTSVETSLTRSSQDGLVLFQVFLNGFDAIAGIGHADGIGLAELVMDEQLADRLHTEMSIRHAPELAGFQWLINVANRLGFYHGSSCALTFH